MQTHGSEEKTPPKSGAEKIFREFWLGLLTLFILLVVVGCLIYFGERNKDAQANLSQENTALNAEVAKLKKELDVSKQVADYNQYKLDEANKDLVGTKKQLREALRPTEVEGVTVTIKPVDAQFELEALVGNEKAQEAADGKKKLNAQEELELLLK